LPSFSPPKSGLSSPDSAFGKPGSHSSPASIASAPVAVFVRGSPSHGTIVLTAIEQLLAEIKIMAAFETPEKRYVGALHVFHAYVCGKLFEEPLTPAWTPETDRLLNKMTDELATAIRATMDERS
jgi:hypothetical protein